jgi:(+)-trans-carveol dehydrogenase
VTDRVRGKVAFITGAARGQGRSHAIALAEEGADIIAVDICAQIEGVNYPMSTMDDLKETVRLVEATGQRIIATVADVRDFDAIKGAVDDGVAEFGRLDIVLANAGIVSTDFQTPRMTAFRNVVDVNLTGVFATIEATRQHLIDGGRGGSIVITSSLAGLRALGAGGGYTESKHGLVGLMRATATELAPHMIRVNSLHPTSVLTPMIDNENLFKLFRPDLEHPTISDAEIGLASLNLMPVAYVETRDITNAVLFLVSDEGRYITGVTLPIDAGGSIK